MILVIWTNLLDLTDMVNLMNLEILLTWIDFDGSVESGGSGGPFKFGDSDDTGKLVISVDMVADIICVNFFTQAHFQKFENVPQKSA